VEVSLSQSLVLVRDSKNVSWGVLTFKADAWREFLSGVQAGEFDWQPEQRLPVNP
jgi:hypothetical protein